MRVLYGTGQIEGKLIRDRVCLNNSTVCVNNMQLLGAVSQKGLDGLAADGIVGMGPGSAGAKNDLLFMA